MTDRVLTAAEVAALLKVDPSTVRRLTRAKRLPCLRLGKRLVRYTEAHVDAFARRCEVGRRAVR